MTDLFWYQREVKYNKKLTPEKEGDSTSEVVTKTVWDCFNVNKVVRGHWTSEKEFTILLDDGHEQAEDLQKPIWKDNRIVKYETKRERAWYVSQIPLREEDTERFMEMYGKSVGKQLLKEMEKGQ